MHACPAVVLALAFHVAAQVPSWTEHKVTTKPIGRQNHAMAYDSARKKCVMFGGWDGSARSNETWEWNGAAWTKVTTSTTPSGRDAMALAYDSFRKVTVMTGGYATGSETWEYNGTDWTQKSPTNTHALGAHTPMVYDSARKVCVLHGGGQTWEWNGVIWTKKTPANNPGNGPMAYDSLRQVTVILAGNQTWEYDGTNWTRNITKTVPPGRGAASAMVYDSARQVIVVFGGCGASQRDTWEYDGFDWRKISFKGGPSEPRCYIAMAYDSQRRRTLLFGGRDQSGTTAVLQADTWEYMGRPCYLSTDTHTVQKAKGGTQQLFIDGGSTRANRLFWIFGSFTGTTPGIRLDGLDFPLNPDIYTDLAIVATNSSNLVNFRGVLDSSGKATARLIVPVVPSAGNLHHAALLYLGKWDCTTNPVVLMIR
jgi:hypothetical protein